MFSIRKTIYNNIFDVRGNQKNCLFLVGGRAPIRMPERTSAGAEVHGLGDRGQPEDQTGYSFSIE